MFIDRTLFLKFNLILLSNLCFSNLLWFTSFLLLFDNICITFVCGSDKLIRLVEKKGSLGSILLIGVPSLQKNVEATRLAMLTS